MSLIRVMMPNMLVGKADINLAIREAVSQTRELDCCPLEMMGS